MWRSWKAKGQEHAAHPHMEWGRQMAFVNHFYFYCGIPSGVAHFWKTNAYAPYPIWIWLNGHEWAKRQCEKTGIGYTALDNGFRDCEDPTALQRICDRLGPGAVKSFFWRWLRRLPSPFTTADLRAGYTYELAFRQFEISDTRVFDRPAAGRAYFEQVIRDHLDVGRPDQVALVFNRRINTKTPGTFRTRVVTRGVDSQLNCYYKASTRQAPARRTTRLRLPQSCLPRTARRARRRRTAPAHGAAQCAHRRRDPPLLPGRLAGPPGEKTSVETPGQDRQGPGPARSTAELASRTTIRIESVDQGSVEAGRKQLGG